MTDKELRKLRREDLLQILISQQRQIDELTQALEDSEKALQDKRIAIEESGSVAEAALRLNDVFARAQDAADHYESELKLRAEALMQQAEQAAAEAQVKADGIVREGEREAKRLIDEAKRECERMRSETAADIAPQPVEPEQKEEKRRGGLLHRRKA